MPDMAPEDFPPAGLGPRPQVRLSPRTMATVTFRGACGCVTGSSTELAWGERRLLVDCGLYQGDEQLERRNRAPFGFAAREISAVVLTHAHLDHTGLLPRLVAEGFSKSRVALERQIDVRYVGQSYELTLPFVPGYRWHSVARAWRTPVLGELAMGFTSRRAFRGTLPAEIADRAYDEFDHGTQRAVLKLYRDSPPDVLARAGERLGELSCPALIEWPTADPYIGAEFGQLMADALGGETRLEHVDAGHYPWLERPELIARVAEFVR